MVNESTGGATHAQRISLTAHEKRHFVATMCQMTGLGNTSLNKYAKIAGVPTAKLGDRNFCWTNAEAIKILTAILDGNSEAGVSEHCQAALERLSHIPI
ncbi:MAG: hypothetical protein K8T91_18585 [Planctomycetes bacterium]|nr:hypothetical protein [Planctomycetota bacterium]